MVAHVVILAATLCAAQPAIDEVAGDIPKLPLPFAIALSVLDIGCAFVLHAPPVTALKQILPDVWTVVGDLPKRRKAVKF